jgi:hypothetical protein
MMGAVIKLFQVKNEAVAGTNRLWNKNQNRFYSIKSRSYAVLFQRSKQNPKCVGYGEKISFASPSFRVSAKKIRIHTAPQNKKSFYLSLRKIAGTLEQDLFSP